MYLDAFHRLDVLASCKRLYIAVTTTEMHSSKTTMRCKLFVQTSEVPQENQRSSQIQKIGPDRNLRIPISTRLKPKRPVIDGCLHIRDDDIALIIPDGSQRWRRECTRRLTSQFWTRLYSWVIAGVREPILLSSDLGREQQNLLRHATPRTLTHAQATCSTRLMRALCRSTVLPRARLLNHLCLPEIITTTKQVSGAVHCRVSFLKLDIYYDPVSRVYLTLTIPRRTLPDLLCVWHSCRSYPRLKTFIFLDLSKLQAITL